MYCNILIDADGNYYCQSCKVPFTGPFTITERDIKAIGGNLKKFKRPCNLQVGSTGWVPPPMPVPRSSLPIIGQPGADYTACIFRDPNHSRTVQCKTCAGTVNIKVFPCAHYGECALTDKAPDVAVCNIRCPHLKVR